MDVPVPAKYQKDFELLNNMASPNRNLKSQFGGGVGGCDLGNIYPKPTFRWNVMNKAFVFSVVHVNVIDSNVPTNKSQFSQISLFNETEIQNGRNKFFVIK